MKLFPQVNYHRCLNCLFNMPILPTGSGNGYKEKFWKLNLTTGRPA